MIDKQNHTSKNMTKTKKQQILRRITQMIRDGKIRNGYQAWKALGGGAECSPTTAAKLFDQAIDEMPDPVGLE